MHGMINRGLECFVRSIYGADAWSDVCAAASLPFSQFETMLYYDDFVTEQVLDGLIQVTKRPRANLLEDFGTFIVSEHSSPTVRKLLRLGGETFVEFLYSLEDIHDRVSIAVPDLDLPILNLRVQSASQFTVNYESSKLGYGAIFLGLLRAMADGYQTLITISHIESIEDNISKDCFEIEVLDETWSSPEPFIYDAVG